MRWLLAIGELAVLCWFVAIGMEAIIQRVAGMRSPFTLREFHHMHVGLLLVVWGWWLDTTTGTLVQVLGIIISADDLFQHHRQTLGGYVDFLSPLHVLFARTVWRLPVVRYVVQRLDEWWPAGVVLGLLVIWLAT